MMPAASYLTSALTAILLLASAVSSAYSNCNADSFQLASDVLPGALITNIQAHEIKGRSIDAVMPYFEAGTVDNTCEVIISYIYPNTNSTQIDVVIWLPKQWNERFLGTGGGAWMTTMGPAGMLLPNSDGFATALTNGGLTGSPWAPTYTLLSSGNPNKQALERLGYRSIHEMTVLAKIAIKTYYGKASKTNIFSGCSTGGRQGLMEASRYPQDYDGIVAGAPASRWNELIIGSMGGAALMAEYKYAPSPCELQAITAEAVKACDGLDGKMDGIIARPDLCKFHASTVVGKEYVDDCEGGTGQIAKISPIAAKIIQQMVEGIYATDGEKVTPGMPWGNSLWSPLSLASTKMHEKTGQRVGIPTPISHQWLHDILLGGLGSFDYSSLTVDKVQTLMKRSKAEFEYTFEPQPDLSEFAERGGKLLTYHGLEDDIISPHNTLQKYADVQDAMFPRHTLAQGTEKMQEFWRLFLLPGSQHCAPLPGKAGPSSMDAYRQVLQWVEDGSIPERFQAYKGAGSPYNNMCSWPSKPFWNKVGGHLECQSGVSAWDAIPTLSEATTVFFEHLPSMLYLEPKPDILRSLKKAAKAAEL